MLKIKKMIALILCVMIVCATSVAFADDAKDDSNATEITQSETEIKSEEDKTQTDENTDEANPEEDKTQTGENTDETKPEEDKTQTGGNKANDSEKQNETLPTINPELVDWDAEVFLNGQKVNVAVKYADGVSFLPLRAVSELLNCCVAWRASDTTAHILKENKSIMFKMNSPEFVTHKFKVEDKFAYMDKGEVKYINNGTQRICAPVVDNTMYIPLRALVEDALKADVNCVSNKIEIKMDNIGDFTIDDLMAKNYIETYCMTPEDYTSNTVTVIVRDNRDQADEKLGDGVSVTLNGQTKTAANGGRCEFTDIDDGTHKIETKNVPQGYKAVETSVTVQYGENKSVTVYLNKIKTNPEDGNKNENGADASGTQTK